MLRKHGLTIAFLFACMMLTLKKAEFVHTGPKTHCGKIGQTTTDTLIRDKQIIFNSYCPIVEQRKYKRGLIIKL